MTISGVWRIEFYPERRTHRYTVWEKWDRGEQVIAFANTFDQAEREIVKYQAFKRRHA